MCRRVEAVASHFPGGLAHGPGLRGIQEESIHGSGQGFRIASGNEHARSPRLDQVADAAQVGADRRPAHGSRLDHGPCKVWPRRRKHKKLAGCDHRQDVVDEGRSTEDRRDFRRPHCLVCPFVVSGEPKRRQNPAGDPRLERPRFGKFHARGHDSHSRKPRRKLANRFDERKDSLDFREAAHVGNGTILRIETESLAFPADRLLAGLLPHRHDVVHDLAAPALHPRLSIRLGKENDLIRLVKQRFSVLGTDAVAESPAAVVNCTMVPPSSVPSWRVRMLITPLMASAP